MPGGHYAMTADPSIRGDKMRAIASGCGGKEAMARVPGDTVGARPRTLPC